MTGKIRKNARKAAATRATTVDDVQANTLRAPALAGKSRERAMAELALNPVMTNASIARTFAKDSMGTIDLTESLAVMREKVERVKAGDLSEVEATLILQAVALDTIFNNLARRAAVNIGEHLNAADTYLRLALKAQGQCRATLETLAEIKNPRAVAFVKQANIAHGAQQVNNAAPPPAAASRTEKSANPSNELSGASYELLPDTGTSALAGRVNPQVETVGAIDRATDGSRKG